jgi:hypothetical protein
MALPQFQSDRISVLNPWQVWDVSRGAYYVKLENTKQKHLGHPVYKDAYGAKFIVTGALG